MAQLFCERGSECLHVFFVVEVEFFEVSIEVLCELFPVDFVPVDFVKVHRRRGREVLASRRALLILSTSILSLTISALSFTISALSFGILAFTNSAFSLTSGSLFLPSCSLSLASLLTSCTLPLLTPSVLSLGWTHSSLSRNAFPQADCTD